MAIAFRLPDIEVSGQNGKESPKKTNTNQSSQTTASNAVPTAEISEVDSTSRIPSGSSPQAVTHQFHCSIHKCSVSMSNTSSSCIFVLLSVAIWVIAFTIIATLAYICDDNCSFMCQLCCTDGKESCGTSSDSDDQGQATDATVSGTTPQRRTTCKCGRTTRQPDTSQSGENCTTTSESSE